jgi:hypothetical protein
MIREMLRRITTSLFSRVRQLRNRELAGRNGRRRGYIDVRR